MTIQEKAIEQLERISEHLSVIGEKEDYTDVAIKALETTCIEDYPTCTECEHYDSEKHYCPRFCQVIRDTLAEAQPSKDCRNCKKWDECPCGKEGHENGTSIGYSIGECKNYEPCEDCISRQAVIDFIIDNYGVGFTSLTNGIRDYLPSVTPQASEEDIHREHEQAYMLGYEDASKKFRTEPCEECISRTEAIDKLTKFYNMVLDDINIRDIVGTLERLPSVTPQIEPCEDCISRAEMLKYQQYLHGKMSNEENHKLWEFIKDLPSVTPQRPKGKWIRITNGAMREKYICSECGRQIEEDGIEELIAIKYPYCHCGAEMEGEENV